MKYASNTLEVRTLDGKPVRTVELPTIGTSSGFLGNEDEDAAYYTFTSFTQPLKIYKTSIKTGETSLWAEVKVPVDPSKFSVEQVWYPSKDGTKISMFLVHKKDLKKDGSTPWLMWGYGGFNVSETPGFSGGIFPWLEAGGGYAVANLRGGGEYGETWHRGGMLGKKQNVFDDFIGAAEYLVRERYTRADRLAIRGGSNGGLLMGAVTTQRPDLFRAVICQVPLLDMIRYHLFGAGQVWIPEYGSADDADQFKWLFAYSPYHHVKAGTKYPALLMMSADADDRVDPMHARKMVAALQAANTGEHPILLRIEQHSGHGGADLVKQAVEQQADAYAFLMHELGLSRSP
jgi:prolyl oligopeptidase